MADSVPNCTTSKRNDSHIIPECTVKFYIDRTVFIFNVETYLPLCKEEINLSHNSVFQVSKKIQDVGSKNL
ncbi:hypothetical protein ASPCADRAFT_211910 [Aspergillus carbonarius ITEM 5010]|uniref:Uncharacterized protein n=1 Tax=Aspergillus carbonarius (strain ITEM 5010) TaxID=602072 RepID=A0A1R3R8C3_ASPC5|nr:hypothetical protein ASPCADRAFT_211910 [Aspergillus carbonarius ITEM 5010]